MFATEEREEELLDKFKGVISDWILVFREIVTNPDIYRYLREVLESRAILVPELVTDTQAGSFVAKIIIAAVWASPGEKVLRDSLLLEYHNTRKEVVNANKGFLERRFTPSLSPEADAPSSSPSQQAGTSASYQQSQEAYARAGFAL